MPVLRVLGRAVLFRSGRRRAVVVGRRQGRYASRMLAGNTCGSAVRLILFVLRSSKWRSSNVFVCVDSFKILKFVGFLSAGDLFQISQFPPCGDFPKRRHFYRASRRISIYHTVVPNNNIFKKPVLNGRPITVCRGSS